MTETMTDGVNISKPSTNKSTVFKQDATKLGKEAMEQIKTQYHLE